MKLASIAIQCVLGLALLGCQLDGTASGSGKKLTDWQLSFNTTRSGEQQLAVTPREVPTVENTGEDSSLGYNVEEVFLLDRGETLQSFDVRPGTKDVVYAKVCAATSDGSKPTRSEIFLRGRDSGVVDNVVPASEGVFFLDPTIDSDKLYYISTAYGGLSLMQVPIAETMPTQLTQPRGRVRSPRVSNGTVVYVDQASFDGRGDISVVQASGGPRRVFGSGSQPTWSTDAKYLVFVENQTIYRVPVDGRGQRTELHKCDSAGEVKDPALSPDGKLLAFAERRAGANANYDIYVLQVGSNQPKQVSSLGSHDDMPRWADANTLFFRSTRGKQWGIWSVTLSQAVGNLDSEAVSK